MCSHPGNISIILFWQVHRQFMLPSSPWTQWEASPTTPFQASTQVVYSPWDYASTLVVGISDYYLWVSTRSTCDCTLKVQAMGKRHLYPWDTLITVCCTHIILYTLELAQFENIMSTRRFKITFWKILHIWSLLFFMLTSMMHPSSMWERASGIPTWILSP